MIEPEYADIQLEDWAPTLYDGIESALFRDEPGKPVYYVVRWTDHAWVTTDGESREDAVRKLIEMVPDIFALYEAKAPA